MLSTGLKIGSALLCIAAIPAFSGCAKTRAGADAFPSMRQGKKHGGMVGNRTSTTSSIGIMPPQAKPGECYAPVYLSPEFDTVSERICVREESEKIEIIPAKYDWVEERVLVKEASTLLVEIPAQFDVQDHVVETSPGHSTWVRADDSLCVADTPGPPPEGIFCLESKPPTTMTFQTERLVKGPRVKKVTVPAEYRIIRKQKLVRPASTRRVTIPAEFREVRKTVLVAPGRVEWRRVDCDSEAITINRKVRSVRDRNW